MLNGLGSVADCGGSLALRGRRPHIGLGFGKMTVCSLVLLAPQCRSGRKDSALWQEEPPSRRQVWWQRTFCTPVLWVSLLRRWMRWKLEHNPIGGSDQRTWSGRLVTWGWFAVIISIYSAV